MAKKKKGPVAAFITLQWLPKRVRMVLSWVVMIGIFALMVIVFMQTNTPPDTGPGIREEPRH